ncbi:MAG: SPOR domain-containing protein, partial [Bacteroidota bacterium]
GKKKAAPVVVDVPVEETTPPVTQEPVVEPPAAVDTTLEENLTRLEATAQQQAQVSTAKKHVVTGTGMYTIQISSWPDEQKANKQAQAFADAGFDAFVEPLGKYYRVCIGHFETKAAAKEQMEKMEHMLESMPLIAKVGK